MHLQTQHTNMHLHSLAGSKDTPRNSSFRSGEEGVTSVSAAVMDLCRNWLMKADSIEDPLVRCYLQASD